MSEQVEGYFLGLQVPAAKPMTLRTFADAVGVITKDEAIKIITNPKRVAGRQRFGDDWIKDQGQRSSCNAYAGAAALERARDFRNCKRVVLGPEFLYANINGGRDSGSMLEDGRKSLTDIGCAPKEYVKYQSYLKREQSPEAIANAGRFRIGESLGVHSEEELWTAIAMNFICVVATHVTNGFMKLDDEEISGGGDGPGNHAECCDDVALTKAGEFRFDLPNSWNLRFGNRGRSYVTWKRHLRHTVNYHQFYAIRTTVDDSVGDHKLPG